MEFKRVGTLFLMLAMLFISTVRLSAQQTANGYASCNKIFITDSLYKKLQMDYSMTFFRYGYSSYLTQRPVLGAAAGQGSLSASEAVIPGLTLLNNNFPRLNSAGMLQAAEKNIFNPAPLLAAGKLPVLANPVTALSRPYENLFAREKATITGLNAGKPGLTLPAGLSGISSGSLLPLNSVPLTSSFSLANINSPVANVLGVKNQLNNGVNRFLQQGNGLAGQATARFKAINDAVGKSFQAVQSPSFSANLSLENDLRYNPVLLAPAGTKFQNVFGVRGSLMIMGIPLRINISNNQAAFNGQNPFAGSLYKLGFSPNMFSGLLRNQLQQYADLKNSIFNGFNFTQFVHQTINDQVHSLQSNAAGLKNSPLLKLLENPSDLQGLFKLNEAQLRSKLYALAAVKNELSPAGAEKMAPLTEAEKQLNMNRADSLAQVILSLKKELSAKGLDPEKLILEENYLTGKTSPAFNASEALSGLTDKKPASAAQSLFSGIKDLRMGSFGTSLPGADGGQSQLMNGANLTVKLGYYPLTFGFGKLDDLNSLKDASYQNSLYVVPKNISYVGAEMPHGVFGDVKISVISSFSAQSNNVQYSAPTLPGNAVTLTLTKIMNINNFGHLAVDISKSSTLFDNSYQPGSDAILLRRAGGKSNLASNLFESLSVGFRHNLNIKELNASDNVYFSYSGLGYQNPANNGYSGGAMKFGGDLKKSFYKSKLTFDLRSDYSSTPLSYTTNAKWKNYQVQLNSRYQVTNHFNLSLKYLASGTATTASPAGVSGSVYNAQKYQFDANDTYKIGQYFTTMHFSIADQSFRNSYLSTTGANLLNFTYTQSLVFKTSSLTGTFFYNKELATATLLGDMLNSEVIYQYQLAKMVQLSSGVSYLSNSAMAKQVGIKQSLQVLAGKRYDISASVNYMKNLVTPLYADLYPSCQGELTLKYYFKVN